MWVLCYAYTCNYTIFWSHGPCLYFCYLGSSFFLSSEVTRTAWPFAIISHREKRVTWAKTEEESQLRETDREPGIFGELPIQLFCRTIEPDPVLCHRAHNLQTFWAEPVCSCAKRKLPIWAHKSVLGQIWRHAIRWRVKKGGMGCLPRFFFDRKTWGRISHSWDEMLMSARRNILAYQVNFCARPFSYFMVLENYGVDDLSVLKIGVREEKFEEWLIGRWVIRQEQHFVFPQEFNVHVRTLRTLFTFRQY